MGKGPGRSVREPGPLSLRGSEGRGLKAVFADTGYWIALLNPKDVHHARARDLSQAMAAAQLVTSEMVLTEWLNDFGRRGELLRTAATVFIARLRADPRVTVVPQTSTQFDEAFWLYAERADKGWSHTDCASFRLMASHGISAALTPDRHFEQAGFKALLK